MSRLLRFCHYVHNIVMDVITLYYLATSTLLILTHGIILLPDVTSCDVLFPSGWPESRLRLREDEMRERG